MNLLEQANQLLSENRLKEADFHYRSVLEANPNQGEALFGLGRIAMRLEKYPEAVYLLRQACQRLPKVLNPLFALADAFDAMQQGKDAFDILEYCCKIAPHNAEAFYRFGQHLQIYGYTKQATDILKQGLTCPDSDVTPYIYYDLANIDARAITKDHIEHLHALLARSKHTQADVVLHYTLAKSYHNLGDKSQAFAHWRLANELQSQRCQPLDEGFDHFISDIIDVFNEELITQTQDPVKPSFTPVFIIGMPRSGSTLLEQMLCQHPSIASLGENDAISRKLMAYLSQSSNKPFPQCMASTNRDMRTQLRQLYANEISKHKLSNAVILNKLPANFQSVGAIKALFPNAQFIDMRRSFYPMAWSVFTHYFGANEAFFCDMNALMKYYEGYDRLMQHWRHCIPQSIATVHYEQLVEDPQALLRPLFAWLGLTYTQASLKFHDSHTQVNTLSRHQVRQPLYTNANKAYKEYEASFKECFSREVKVSVIFPEQTPTNS
ncbi:tetratricopeptide repeat-containing sulfotransferase family protein [Pseudoalteromonas pernae]|uniref:tetratricopeptide repeat-containing sulfotransferase family protein n=1 Tax=Pseudoalteromonas pernae TaxID=3118054 RepID=UPI0032424CCC